MDEDLLYILDHGIPFVVRYCAPGAQSRRGTHPEKPVRSLSDYSADGLVQFYDARYQACAMPARGANYAQHLGQFITEYPLSAFTAQTGRPYPWPRVGTDGKGLDLHGGARDWYIDGANVRRVIEWLERDGWAVRRGA